MWILSVQVTSIVRTLNVERDGAAPTDLTLHCKAPRRIKSEGNFERALCALQGGPSIPPANHSDAAVGLAECSAVRWQFPRA